MSGTFNKRGSYLYHLKVNHKDVAVFLDKEAVQELAEKATTHVMQLSVKGPIMCQVIIPSTDGTGGIV